jgi:diacylglycerol kinase family enzyme
MSAEEFAKFDAIVSIAGDGIPHEIINGFMKRPDCLNLTLNLGRSTF